MVELIVTPPAVEPVSRVTPPVARVSGPEIVIVPPAPSVPDPAFAPPPV